MRLTMVLLAVLTVGGGCVLKANPRYEDLDELVFGATGKHLYEVFTEDDIARIEAKAWGADLGDLVRITDVTAKHVHEGTVDDSAASLDERQRQQVRINLRLALGRVLGRITDMRMMQSKRDIHVGGCESSAVTPDGAAPGC